MILENPLDRIDTERNSKDLGFPVGLTIEVIFGLTIFTGLLIRDLLGFPRTFELTFLCACILGVIYLFANWWLNKPFETTTRTILMTIFYGFVSFLMTYGVIFMFLYLPGKDDMVILCFGFLVVAMVADLFSSIRKIKVINHRTGWRLSILSVILIFYSVAGEEARVKFSYRKYPDFLQYYEKHRQSQGFSTIEENYFVSESTNDTD